MVRTILCAALAFVFATGVVMADEPKKTETRKEEKKGKRVSGKVKKIDAEKGTITLMVGKKGEEAKEMEYKIGDDVKFTIIQGEDKKEGVAAKEGLKAEQLKDGATVVLTLDGDKVTAVQIGRMNKKK